jgi:putative transposase
MPKNLKRYYGKGDLHFITFSCYRRLALLGTVRARNVFVKALGEVRKKSCVRPLYAAAANEAERSRG